MKDEDDIALEALFRSDPVADDGFSAKVASRVRRRVWVRRLALPTALVIGLAISARTLLQVIAVFSGFLNAVFSSAPGLDRLPFAAALQPSTILVGASLLLAVLLVTRILEE